MYNPPMTEKERYLADLMVAQTKLAELQQRHIALDVEMAELRKKIIALGTLSGMDLADELLKDIGLSEMSATAMAWAGRALTPPEIKALIAKFGYDIEKHSNPLASIHTTLKRMERAGKVRSIKQADGTTAYERAPQVETRGMHKNRMKFRTRGVRQ